jgi:hypothetical protein
MDPLTVLSVAQTLRGGSRKKGALGMIDMIGMKNLLALVGLAVVGFGTAGWYLGWYNVATQKDAQGHTHVELEVDSSKVQHDLQQGEQKVLTVIEQKTATTVPAQAPANQQTPTAPAQPRSMTSHARIGDIQSGSQPAPQPPMPPQAVYYGSPPPAPPQATIGAPTPPAAPPPNFIYNVPQPPPAP